MSRSSNRSLESATPLVSSLNGLRSSLAVAAGEPIRTLAIRTQCNPSTVWRICRRYEDAGLPDLQEPPQRAGRPAGFPPCNVYRSFNWPARSQSPRVCTSPMDEPGIPPSGRRWDRPGHQRSDGPSDPQSGGPPAASHAVLADVSHRHSLQGACREDPLGATPTPSGRPGGASGWSVPMRNPTSKSWNRHPHPAFDPRLDCAA